MVTFNFKPNIITSYAVNISSCDVGDNRCASNLSSICCFLYVVDAVARYFHTQKVAVFLFPDNDINKQKFVKLLSAQFIENQIFTFDQKLLKLNLKKSDTNLLFLLWSHKNTKEQVNLLNRMIKLNLLNPPKILYILANDLEDPRSFLEGVHLSPLNFVAVIQKSSNQNDKGYLVTDVYGADEKHTLATRLIGNMWIHRNIVTYNKTAAFPTKTRKLQNYTLRIGALRRPPFTDYYPQTDELSGVLGNILMNAKMLLSLSYDIHLSGEDIATRTLDIFEELRLNKSDLILGVHTMSRRRIKLYSFSRAVAFGRYFVTYQRPELTRFASGYKGAFTNEMWNMLLIFILIFNTILLFSYKTFARKKMTTENKVGTTVFNTVSVLLQKGDAYLQHGQGSQIIWFTFCIFAFLIFSSYSSKLTSLFTVYTEKVPFSSFNNLLDNSNFRVTAIINSSAYKRIKSAKRGIYFKMKQKIVTFVESSKAGIEYVYTHSDAVFYDHDIQVCPYLRDNCSFATIPSTAHYKHSFHLVFTKYHSLVNSFNNILTILHETGILSKIIEPVIWVSEVYCTVPRKYDPLSITQIFSLIYMLSLGIAIAVFVLIVECIIDKQKKQ